MGMESGLGDLWISRNNLIPDEASGFVNGLKFGKPLVFSPDGFLDFPVDFFIDTASSDSITSGFGHDHSFAGSVPSGSSELILGQNSFFELPGASTGVAPSMPNVVSPAVLSPSEVTNSSEDTEDTLLSYISNMLMEEDVDGKYDIYPEDPALLAAEKPFYEILSEKSPPAPDQPPPDSSTSGESHGDGGGSIRFRSSSGSNHSSTDETLADKTWPYDPVEYLQLQDDPLSIDVSSQFSLSSSTSGLGNAVDGSEESLVGSSFSVANLLARSQPAFQFQKGLEEARKFLPSDNKLAIDVEAYWLDVAPKQKQQKKLVEVKLENEETKPSIHPLRGRKNPHDNDLDVQEGRSSKQSALSMEETLQLRDEFDKVLLFNRQESITELDELRAELLNAANKISQSINSKGSGGGGRGRGKKQPKKEVVDLRTLLIHCAQSVAADDRRSASELLKQIKKHSSVNGDANQRLAHYFADGLEARLAGKGIENYRSIVLKEIPIIDILKAYKLYMAAFPFKRISCFFSNKTICSVTEKATKVHVIDYGILYGFQWPCLMQHFASRPGGPPRLRITGIDEPMPGFRPTEFIDETGRRLADYARTFGISFEYRAIATSWETIRVEDLNIEEDEMVIVNSLYQFRKLVDETVVVDGPRDKVLNTIRELKPAVFIHGIINGSYSAPFFVTRFREALFHFYACFDMVETIVPQEDDSRRLIEKYLFGREAINVIACEGAERMERPETYKHWHARNIRSGFTQVPLNPDVLKKAKDKFRPYHKDFILDVDNQWLLQGWKGRILNALSTWKPCPSRCT